MNLDEKLLCHAALDASITEVKRLCNGYRWSTQAMGITIAGVG
jgi:hypothetical protein